MVEARTIDAILAKVRECAARPRSDAQGWLIGAGWDNFGDLDAGTAYLFGLGVNQLPLNIERSGPDYFIRWLTGTPGLILQQTDALDPLAIWAAVTGDAQLTSNIRSVPPVVAAAVRAAETWATELPDLHAPSAGIVFGTRHAWAGALEGALLLKEVSGVPAEGVETREGATSAMYPLRPGHIVGHAESNDGLPAEEDHPQVVPPPRGSNLGIPFD